MNRKNNTIDYSFLYGLHNVRLQKILNAQPLRIARKHIFLSLNNIHPGKSPHKWVYESLFWFPNYWTSWNLSSKLVEALLCKICELRLIESIFNTWMSSILRVTMGRNSLLGYFVPYCKMDKIILTILFINKEFNNLQVAVYF